MSSGVVGRHTKPDERCRMPGAGRNSTSGIEAASCDCLRVAKEGSRPAALRFIPHANAPASLNCLRFWLSATSAPQHECCIFSGLAQSRLAAARLPRRAQHQSGVHHHGRHGRARGRGRGARGRARRHLGGVRVSRHAFHGNPRDDPEDARGHRARHVVQQREDGLRSGARCGARRPPRPRHDEARRPERGGRPVRELRARLDARRARRRRRRRPGHAQLAERAGQPVLRGLRARPVPRARDRAGRLRHDA